MIWEYGNYKFKCNLNPPTLRKFYKWKEEFFKFPKIENYDVWLTGGFLENWRTLDIDIVLTNKPVYSEIQRILIDGVRLGIEKYNMFVDLTHWNRKPLNYSGGEISLTKIGKLVTANKIVQNNKLITDWSDGKKVYSNLWYVEREYPKEKQLNRNYKNKPILLQKGLESGIKAYS